MEQFVSSPRIAIPVLGQARDERARAFAAMQEVATAELRQCAGVLRGTIALPQDGPIPVQAEEVQRAQDVVGRARADTRRVEVFDPDQPFTPVRARVEVAADGSDQ